MRPMDTVARLGGDEFAIVASVADVDAAEAIAHRIAESLSTPFHLEGEMEVFVQASLGIALSNAAQEPPEATVGDLLRDADVAMYAAKASEVDSYKVFRPEMRTAVLSQLELEAALQRAVSQDELEVHFQPVVALEDGRVVDLEALVRWRTPGLGLVAPEYFIPLAEKTGLIVQIGRQVLRTACKELRKLQEELGLWPLGVSVNVSARQLGDPGFVQDVYDALHEAQLDASCLTLEITETILMSDADGMAARLQSLRALGIRVAIDDFGTGYSSLSYLKRFPLDAVKIDRSFVGGMTNGPEDAAVAEAIVKLAETFDLVTVAEGIDTAAQLRELHRLGCHLGQGFYLSKPLPVGELVEFLASYSPVGSGDAVPPPSPASV
jgi:predicted signal transduction protein with EAL and GGDEF domain